MGTTTRIILGLCEDYVSDPFLHSLLSTSKSKRNGNLNAS